MPDTPIKLLHTADLHLDAPLKSLALKNPDLSDAVATASRAALTKMVDFALAERVRALLIAGDLFDGAQRSARTAVFVAEQCARLGQAGIDVFLIRGNHDAENARGNALPFPDNVHEFDGRGGKIQLAGTDIWIHGVSFRDTSAPDSLLPKFAPPVPDAVNIGLLHTSLGGTVGHDVYAPCRVADLVAHGFDYWGLGHIHRRQIHAEAPHWVVMPGMPQGRDIGEAGPKSATLLTVTDGAITLSEIPTAEVLFARATCDLTGVEEMNVVPTRLRDTLSALAANSTKTILRLSLEGATPLAWQIARDPALWTEQAAAFAEATGTLWLEQLDIALTDPQEQQAGPLAELTTLMDAIAREPGFAEDAQRQVSETLANLPPARRALLAPDAETEAALARNLAQSGAHLVIARLRGAG